MSNVGIPMWDFSFLPKYDDFSMYIVLINDDKFIQMIKIWAEMRKPTLEFVGIPTLDIGIPT